MPPVSDPMSRVRDRNSSFKKASKGFEPKIITLSFDIFNPELEQPCNLGKVLFVCLFAFAYEF